MPSWSPLVQPIALFVAGTLGFLSLALIGAQIIWGQRSSKIRGVFHVFPVAQWALGAATFAATVVHLVSPVLGLFVHPLQTTGLFGFAALVPMLGNDPGFLEGFFSVCSMLGAMAFLLPLDIEPHKADLHPRGTRQPGARSADPTRCTP